MTCARRGGEFRFTACIAAGGARAGGGARLEHGASLFSEKMDLVDDEQANVRHVLTPPPASRDSIPFLWRCDDHVRALERSGVGCHIACQFKDRQRRVADKFRAPIMQPLACERLARRGLRDACEARARARRRSRAGLALSGAMYTAFAPG